MQSLLKVRRREGDSCRIQQKKRFGHKLPRPCNVSWVKVVCHHSLLQIIPHVESELDVRLALKQGLPIMAIRYAYNRRSLIVLVDIMRNQRAILPWMRGRSDWPSSPFDLVPVR